MIRRENMADWANDTVTYELGDGRWMTVDRRMVEEYGLRKVARIMGVADQIPTERIPVVQGKSRRRIGTVPGDFDPLFIRSTSFWYDPRPGDFTREGDVWVACRTLGPGDLEAVPGFVREYEVDAR